MSKARDIIEAEDPKGVFRQAVDKDGPPAELMNRVLAFYTRVNGEPFVRKELYRSPNGKIYLHGVFGKTDEHGNLTNWTKSLMLVRDPKTGWREWEERDVGVNRWDDARGTWVPYEESVEDPKNTFRRMRGVPGATNWEQIDYKSDNLEPEGWTEETWTYKNGQFLLTLTKRNENPAAPNEFYWVVAIKGPHMQRWKTGRLANAMGHIQQGIHFDQAYARAIKWADGNMELPPGLDMTHAVRNEAEDPKNFLKGIRNQAVGDWTQVGHDKDATESNAWEAWYFERGKYELELVKWTPEPVQAPNDFYWRAGVKQKRHTGWSLTKLIGPDGEVLKNVPFDQALGWAAATANEIINKRPVSNVTEAEDPKSVFKKATRAGGVTDPSQGKTITSGGVMRRLPSKHIVDAVYIWKQNGKFPYSEGVLQFSLRNYGLVRQEWGSFSHLAAVLTRWLNLEGVDLFINGIPAGKVGVGGDLYHIGSDRVDRAIRAKYHLDEAKGKKKVPVKGEDPKRFFQKQMSRVPEAVLDVLEYMPEDFVKAFQTGETAEWENTEGAAYSDWWPSYDDDNDDPDDPDSNPWTEYAYYFDYRTEAGKLYAIVMSCDKDGDHDYTDEAEVGTPAYEQLEKEYGHQGWARAMKRYWEWVINRGGIDPLGYVMPNRVDVKKTFAVGFKKVGDKIQVIGMRNVSDPPSPPAVMWPELKQKIAEDPDWKRAAEYCLLDDDGFTAATEQDILTDGGKWNEAKQRFDFRIEWTDKEVESNEREHIMRVAQDSLNALNEQ